MADLPLVPGQRVTRTALGPGVAAIPAGSTAPIAITGLGDGETVAGVTPAARFAEAGSSIVPRWGVPAGTYPITVTTSLGRPLALVVTVVGAPAGGAGGGALDFSDPANSGHIPGL
ncbi:hypothetical protein [Methylobacterium oryzihabitans]|uniref:Uncharacterized protein n=1 Tax=Methylobacterium oryzihabitans TaxID=2499852 RepID=A0A3S2V968_9HYPH|nr:hypothetical protein [Methylobacterium oryzihabitans]RVU17494.1 hypothetical protein EOE48_13990 [Methylobacterium oryzihabitans]